MRKAGGHNLMKRSEDNRNTTRRRYTIVEMMMVTAIFLIILSMAIAAWLNSGSQTKLRSAVRLVNAQLNLARAKAVAERTNVGVYFAGSGENYHGYGCRLYYYDGDTKGDPVAGEDWVVLLGGTVFSAAQPSDSEFTATVPAKIVFDSKGRLSGYATAASPPFYVTVGTQNNRKVAADEAYFTIKINPFTGRATTTFHANEN